MDDSNPLKPWLRSIGIGFGLFLAGGLISFAYSYRPLHGAMVHKAAALEVRLDERNQENLKLSDEVARLRSDESERVAPETLAAVKKELAETKRALAQSDKDRKKIERKYKDARTGSARWKKRYETLREEIKIAERAAQAPKPSPPSPQGDVTSPDTNPVDRGTALPAAPATAPDSTLPGSQPDADRGTLQPSPANSANAAP